MKSFFGNVINVVFLWVIGLLFAVGATSVLVVHNRVSVTEKNVDLLTVLNVLPLSSSELSFPPNSVVRFQNEALRQCVADQMTLESLSGSSVFTEAFQFANIQEKNASFWENRIQSVGKASLVSYVRHCTDQFLNDLADQPPSLAVVSAHVLKMAGGYSDDVDNALLRLHDLQRLSVATLN